VVGPNKNPHVIDGVLDFQSLRLAYCEQSALLQQKGEKEPPSRFKCVVPKTCLKYLSVLLPNPQIHHIYMLLLDFPNKLFIVHVT